MFKWIFSDPAMFCGTFRKQEYIKQNNLWKADEIVFKLKLFRGKVASNAGQKKWQRGRPEEIYQNWEIPGCTERFGRSASEHFLLWVPYNFYNRNVSFMY